LKNKIKRRGFNLSSFLDATANRHKFHPSVFDENRCAVNCTLLMKVLGEIDEPVFFGSHIIYKEAVQTVAFSLFCKLNEESPGTPGLVAG